MKRATHPFRPGALLALLALFALHTVRASDDPQAMLSPQQLSHASGQAIYRHVCQACHMPDARGARGAGRFPALAGDPRLASSRYMISVLLMGRSNMPSFRPRPDLRGFEGKVHVTLSDAEIARVVNFVRSHFGNHYSDRVTSADVAALQPGKEATP